MHHSWRYERNCEWVCFSEHIVYAEIAVGTCSLEISIGGRCVCVTDPG